MTSEAIAAPVHIRTRFVAQGLIINSRWELQLTGVQVVLPGHLGRSNPACIALCSRIISSANRAVLASLEANYRITNPEVTTDEHGNPHYGGNGIRVPALREYPEAFQEFVRNVQRELHAATSQLIGLVRWRFNQDGPPDPLQWQGSEWSLDASHWWPMPSQLSAEGHVVHPLEPTPQNLQALQVLSAEPQHEPLAHVLFREATTHLVRNRRSCLVMAVAALEIGVKACIAELVPAAAWLAENVPSPPVEKLLTQYLPTLPARNHFNGKVLQPPPDVMDQIKKAVSARNQVSHRGSEAPAWKSLREILAAIRDVLWLLDFYCGRDWAFYYLRPTTQASLHQPSKPNKT